MAVFAIARIAPLVVSFSGAHVCPSDSLDSMSLLQSISADSSHFEQGKKAQAGQPAQPAAPAAASTSREEVNAIWNTMRDMWPHPAMPEDDGACIQMSMRDNTMVMTDTTFTLPLSMNSNLLDRGAEESKTNTVTDLLTQEVDFGPLRLSKNMKGNEMTMRASTLVINNVPKVYEETVLDNGTPRVPQAPQGQRGSFAQVRAEASTDAGEGTVTGSNLYMYDSQLSMDATHFTMNVGASPSLLQTDSSVVNINKLNINMYMHGNSMSMDNTDFAMIIRGQPQPGQLPDNVASAGMAGDDIARLLLLSMTSFREASTDNSLTQRPTESEELRSVWSWLDTWNEESATADAVNINMYMYDNDMSMDQTIFRMNVGASGTSLSQTDSSGGLHEASSPSEASTVASATVQNHYLYNQQYAMQNTELVIGTSSLLETQSETHSNAQAKEMQPVEQPSDINMYMYRNTMRMTDTVFTMNVGSDSQSLVQTGPSDKSTSGKHAETVNVGSINIKMYMLENDMSMASTTFTWTLG